MSAAASNAQNLHHSYRPPSRKSLDSTHSRQLDETASFQEGPEVLLPEPRLPDLDLPQSELDLTSTFESILAESTTVTESITEAEPEVQRVHKRASNVLKLALENDKLKEELRAMNARLEAAERKQQELRQRALGGAPGQAEGAVGMTSATGSTAQAADS